uniref:Adenosine deaminase, RNA specific n=1 Tax=Hypotaenidia okinawae TaxID=2861861 RepID=A0A6G1S0Y0_9GRUI
MWGVLGRGIPNPPQQVSSKQNKGSPSQDPAAGDLTGIPLQVFLLLLALLSVMSLIPTSVSLLSLKLEVSRVSKRKIFTLFQQLCAKNNRKDLQHLSIYSDAKEAAVAYQEAKQCFFSTLEEMGYGSWIRKPQEEDNFSSLDA